MSDLAWLIFVVGISLILLIFVFGPKSDPQHSVSWERLNAIVQRNLHTVETRHQHSDVAFPTM